MMLALMLLFGCGGTTKDTDIEVDCLGMSWGTFLSARPRTSSALVAVDRVSGESIQRCDWLTSITMNNEAVIGPPTIDQENIVTPQFYINGENYFAVDGDIVFDDLPNERKASGTYAVTAIPLNNPEAGATVSISGRFSWCDYTSQQDCPNTPVDLLPQRFEMDAKLLGAVEGGVSQCVMVHDPVNETLVFEMQYGTVNELNVGRYLSPECTFGTGTLPANKLTFKAAGVSGPGEYGPFEVRADAAGNLLPFVESIRPLAMDDNPLSGNPCDDFSSTSTTVVNEGEACSYSFSESEIEIYCDQATTLLPRGVFYDRDWQIRADCDLITR